MPDCKETPKKEGGQPPEGGGWAKKREKKKKRRTNKQPTQPVIEKAKTDRGIQRRDVVGECFRKTVPGENKKGKEKKGKWSKGAK